MPRQLLDSLSLVISAVFSPFVIALPLAVGVSWLASPNFFKVLEWASISFLFAVAIPLGVIFFLRQWGEVTDIHLSLQLDRPFPFIVGVFSGLLGTTTLILLGAPKVLITLALAYIFLGIWVTLVTFYWKISVHLAGVAATLTAMFIIFGLSTLPFFLLLPAVGWARIYRRKHTLGQVIGGTLQAVLSISLVFFLRELI